MRDEEMKWLRRAGYTADTLFSPRLAQANLATRLRRAGYTINTQTKTITPPNRATREYLAFRWPPRKPSRKR